MVFCYEMRSFFNKEILIMASSPTIILDANTKERLTLP